MPLRKDGSFKPKREVVNCLFLNGGVGDHIGSLVAVDYIVRNYPWVTLLVWVPDFLLEFARNVLPKGTVVRDFTSMKTKYDRNRTTLSTEWDGRSSPMKIHSVDYAFHRLCDEHLPETQKNYLKVKFDLVDTSMFTLPEKYVVMATGYTARVREFDVESVNKVAEYILSKGCTPVFLGQRSTITGAKHVIQGSFSESIDMSKGVDLIDKTSLLQAAKIMQGARAVVGVDCGLLHIAGCTDTAIVGGFTTVHPLLRAPIRNNLLGWKFYPVVPDVSLECRFCQSDTNFLYDHVYTDCMYGDYQCVKQLSADKFITQLAKLNIDE